MAITIVPATKGKAVVKAEAQEPKMSFIQKVIKGETYMVMAQSAVQLEDEFSSLYYTAQNQSNIFLQPPFDPKALKVFTQTNNILNQCVEAMEVNIDGTGHEFVPLHEDDEVDKGELEEAQAFFDEPYPGVSFVKMRRKLRREIESVGYAFLEVLRNMADEVVALRNIETHNVRMVKLDAPVLVTKTVNRNGSDVELQMWERERRFAQRVALKQLVYYREFGTTRNINRNTGQWETKETPVAPEDRGTELLIFGVHPDIETPYFLPRWINQLPSVVGSRRAEEQNLEFLDAGGMPPAIVFVQGGILAKGAADQLRQYLSGQNKNKHRAVVVEAQSSSGTLESAGTVQVKVERFGSERAQDAMYTKYGAMTEECVRVGFRMPPLFLGKAADYNFATAQTAYMVAEEQVFKPERRSFDEVVNMTLVKALGYKSLKFQSLPMVMKDMATIIEALTIAAPIASPESFISEINKVTSLTLEEQEEIPPLAPGQVNPATGTIIPNAKQQGAMNDAKVQQAQNKAVPAVPAKSTDSNYTSAGSDNPTKGITNSSATPSGEAKTAAELADLAQDYTSMKGLTKKRDFTQSQIERITAEVQSLKRDEQRLFNGLVAAYTFGTSDPDLVHIAGCAHTH